MGGSGKGRVPHNLLRLVTQHPLLIDEGDVQRMDWRARHLARWEHLTKPERNAFWRGFACCFEMQRPRAVFPEWGRLGRLLTPWAHQASVFIAAILGGALGALVVAVLAAALLLQFV